MTPKPKTSKENKKGDHFLAFVPIICTLNLETQTDITSWYLPVDGTPTHKSQQKNSTSSCSTQNATDLRSRCFIILTVFLVIIPIVRCLFPLFLIADTLCRLHKAVHVISMTTKEYNHWYILDGERIKTNATSWPSPCFWLHLYIFNDCKLLNWSILRSSTIFPFYTCFIFFVTQTYSAFCFLVIFNQEVDNVGLFIQSNIDISIFKVVHLFI